MDSANLSESITYTRLDMRVHITIDINEAVWTVFCDEATRRKQPVPQALAALVAASVERSMQQHDGATGTCSTETTTETEVTNATQPNPSDNSVRERSRQRLHAER